MLFLAKVVVDGSALALLLLAMQCHQGKARSHTSKGLVDEPNLRSVDQSAGTWQQLNTA